MRVAGCRGENRSWRGGKERIRSKANNPKYHGKNRRNMM